MRPTLPLPSRDPAIAKFLAAIHRDCNRVGRLDRDPLALLGPFREVADREVAGFVAATLAFGQVDLIMRAVTKALAPLGTRPASALASMSEVEIGKAWAGFQYRFCFPSDMVGLMLAIKRARADSGSLEACFAEGDQGGETIVEALGAFSRRINELGRRRGKGIRRGLVPEPSRGSACKRLFLYLRWMVRRDDIDPGGWTSISPSRLVIPIDIHMARVCQARLGFIPTQAPTLSNALRATACFRLYSPEDPVKYDFALTRPGIDPAPGDEAWGCA